MLKTNKNTFSICPWPAKQGHGQPEHSQCAQKGVNHTITVLALEVTHPSS